MPGDSETLVWQVTVRISLGVFWCRQISPSRNEEGQSLTKKIGSSIFSLQAKFDEAYSFEGHTTSARFRVHFLKSGARRREGWTSSPF